MNSKERVKTILDYKDADFVPRQASFVPEVEDLMSKRYHCRGHELYIKLGNDALLEVYGMGTGYYRKGEEYVTEWGIKWRRIKYSTPRGDGSYTEIVESPLRDDAAIESYVPPDPNKVDMSPAKEMMQKYGKDYFIIGGITNSVLEAAQYLRGYDKIFIDMIENVDLVWRIMDISINYHLVLGKELIDLGVDCVWLADDLGTETSMLMSPKTFREVVKPKLAYIIGELKKYNHNIKIAFHTCGHVIPVLDDLIEIGIDILNPVQPEAMDIKYIKKRYSKKLTLWGTIGVQSVFPNGTVKDVEQAVKNAIKTCAPGGGLIIAPSQWLQVDTPIENILAFYKYAREYGKYPISIL